MKKYIRVKIETILEVDSKTAVSELASSPLAECICDGLERYGVRAKVHIQGVRSICDTDKNGK